MAFELPNLPYSFGDLEPHIDARTMEIHHDKHHNAYVTNLNNAIAGTDGEGKSLDELIRNIDNYSPAVRNNGGGHFNHSLFWQVMSAQGGGQAEGDLAAQLKSIEARLLQPLGHKPRVKLRPVHTRVHTRVRSRGK